MYFYDANHEKNFYSLLLEYNKVQGKDPQYDANIYIAAFPEIYKCLHDSRESSGGPLTKLMEWNEEKDKLVPSHPGLTGTTRGLLEIGMSLYNGYFVDLDNTYTEEIVNVIIQAVKLRNRIA